MKTFILNLFILFVIINLAQFVNAQKTEWYRFERNENWTVEGPTLGTDNNSYVWKFRYCYGGVTIITVENPALKNRKPLSIQFVDDKDDSRYLEILWSQFPIGDSVKVTIEHKGELEIWNIHRAN